jgi:subtilisin family serine protease
MRKYTVFSRASTLTVAVMIVVITCFPFTANSSLQQRNPSTERLLKEKYPPCNTEVVAGDVLVKFKNRIPEDALKALVDAALKEFLTPTFNARTFHYDQVGPNQDLYLIHIDGVKVENLVSYFSGPNAEVNKLTLMEDYGVKVEYAQPNYIFYQDDVTPNDYRFPEQWAMLNSARGIGGISAVSAWHTTTGSKQIVVGVVDTGIALKHPVTGATLKHPDLDGNLWEAPRAFYVNAGGIVFCGARTHGFDAERRNCLPAEDSTYHGTRVSGIIGAEGNNAEGIAGVNWSTQIMALRYGAGKEDQLVNAILFAVELKRRNLANVRVLNNSYGYTTVAGPRCRPSSLENAIRKAADQNILFVASAGNSRKSNDEKPHYPSGLNVPNIIAVAGTSPTDQLYEDSNYGLTTVHIGAPGQRILSTDPPDDYDYGSGTSFAAPFVSGAAALILSKCPTLSTVTVKACILDGADRVEDLAAYLPDGKRLNVKKALDKCTCVR